MKQRKMIEINGTVYYADRPPRCRLCYYWKNNKRKCRLGFDHCYYKVPEELIDRKTKCTNCPYRREGNCVTASCYKDLDEWMRKYRKARNR